ncbi:MULTISPECIES: DUF1413 domain-containing protein [Bacillus]|uniref:DUF1413 domain-containing protein n=1 Tax=Bacillus TaxID=1386 RepID=UPI0004682338|nr:MULTISPECIES: DUF1413 domain-containing protein [Bacillus]MED1412362.1 DUF1413 domain-containing protein [Bacillus paramycoides]MED1463597.1 DUF1413 domain-containing protein [Bacillus paramycoides]MED1494468.1 DUF1413 domain-containing protein [Bacillus paramycoides]
MSPTVTIRFNEKEFEAVQKLVKNNSKTAGALIKELALKAAGYKGELEVTVQDIDKEASKLSSGKEFKVRHLFDETLWESYSTGSRLSIGKKFINKVQNDPYFKSKYVFVRKDSDNAAIYRKK